MIDIADARYCALSRVRERAAQRFNAKEWVRA